VAERTAKETRRPARGSTRPERVPGGEIAIQVYLADEAAARAVEDSLVAALSEAGITIGYRAGPVKGSWYRAFRGMIARAASSQTAAEARRAIEIQLLDRFQAGIDGVTGDAVAKLITALGDTSGAVIQVGSVLLVKVEDTIVVRQLTQRELAHWQKNPGLFKDPAGALAELQRAADACHEPAQPGHRALSDRN
jgi:hypothetical protein